MARTHCKIFAAIMRSGGVFEVGKQLADFGHISGLYQALIANVFVAVCDRLCEKTRNRTLEKVPPNFTSPETTLSAKKILQ